MEYRFPTSTPCGRWYRGLLAGRVCGARPLAPGRRLGNVPGQRPISSLARAPDGSLWVGILEEGPGLGLAQLKQGVVKPFVTPTFDGSKVSVTSLLSDRDGNLWVGTDAHGLFRIHGDTVEHYGHTDGLSGDSVGLFLKTGKGLSGLEAQAGSTAFVIRGS